MRPFSAPRRSVPAQARQVAHVMTALDGFAMEALEVPVGVAADAVLTRDDLALGIVLGDAEAS